MQDERARVSSNTYSRPRCHMSARNRATHYIHGVQLSCAAVVLIRCADMHVQ